MKIVKDKLKIILVNRRGFTLLEVLIAIAITAIIGIGVSSGVYQLYNINNLDSAHVQAVKQVENAIHWLNRDVQMAQKVEVNDSNYWIRLTWVTWEDSQKTQVLYLLQNDCMIRKYFIGEDINPTSTATIARNIVTGNTSCCYDSDIDKLTIKITAEGSSGTKQVTETRDIEIYPRPGA